MAAPPKARRALFPLYAFNVEVARAPWVTAEPGIAEIRLQWWIDALGEIASGGVVRHHEVVLPLALCLSKAQARSLIPMIEARSRDIYNEVFVNEEELLSYLDETSGRLMTAAVGVLGGASTETARHAGRAQGVANWLLAVPALKAYGRHPLPDENKTAIAHLAGQGLIALETARRLGVQGEGHAACFALAGVRRILNSARHNPERVLLGKLVPSPFRANLDLMKASFLNRW